jgi:hypothetical protein
MPRLPLLAALLLPVGLGLPAADYPCQPVPFTAVRVTGGFWQAKQEVNRTVTVPFALQQCEDSGRLRNFRPRGRGDAAARGGREGFPEQAADDLSVRRHRRLQGDRGRVLRAEHAARRGAGAAARRLDRAHRRGAGAGRLPLHVPHDAPGFARAQVDRAAALGKGSRSQPRTLLRRSPLRGRRRAFSGDGQAHAARRLPEKRRAALARLRRRQAAHRARPRDRRDGPGQTLPRDGRRALAALAQIFLDARGPGGPPTTSSTSWSSTRTRRSATRCGRTTCTPAWPTWRR